MSIKGRGKAGKPRRERPLKSGLYKSNAGSEAKAKAKERVDHAKPGPTFTQALSNPLLASDAKKCLENEIERALKMHPAHKVTERGIEIGSIAAATRNPDGSQRT